MLAYHSNPKIKAKYLNRVRSHAKAGEIIKGKYWEDGKGCAIGCTIHSNKHSAYEIELGIPQVLAKLEDGIFEGLPLKQAKEWPGKFLKAIKPGTDLSKVSSKFLVWLLEEVIKCIEDEGKETINLVIDLYKRELRGEVIALVQWKEAKSATLASAAVADAAAAYAAHYAAEAAVAAAVYANATYYAAAYTATAAAYAADANNARKTAREANRIKQAEKLLGLLKECGVNNL